jgi:hypothetical protein
MDSLQPDGHLETVLAERIASILWRLYRLQRYESEMVEVYIRGIPDDMAMSLQYSKALGAPDPSEDELNTRYHDHISRRLVGSDDSIAKITRYESHLHRLFLQTLHELEAIQVRRQGGHSPLARLDISAPPAT